MTMREVFELFARYVWPFLVAWNVFVYQNGLTNREQLQDFELYVARNYIAKQDLEKMLTDFERRFEKRFDQLVLTINTK